MPGYLVLEAKQSLKILENETPTYAKRRRMRCMMQSEHTNHTLYTQ